jgi:hypothetical protein
MGGKAVVLKAYMDESGTHDGAAVLAVSAYVAKGSEWQNWTKKWNAAKYPIKIFHANQCQALKGEFEGWDVGRRDALVENLLRVIPSHLMIGIVVAIQMDDFTAALKGRPDLLEVFGNPYQACFGWTLGTILEMADHHGSTQRIEFIQEKNDYTKYCLEAFAYAKEHHNHKDRRISLRFGDKAADPPLQAADILAYEGGKFLRDPESSRRRAWRALDPEKKRLRALRYGKDNMSHLITKLEKYAAETRKTTF